MRYSVFARTKDGRHVELIDTYRDAETAGEQADWLQDHDRERIYWIEPA